MLLFFGAPIIRSSDIFVYDNLAFKTYLLALLVSIMAVFPPAYAIGVPNLGNHSDSVVQRWTWVRLFIELSCRNSVERALLYPALFLGVGSGSYPLRLTGIDLGRHAWPLTPAFGAIAGYILSSIIALTVNSILDLAEQHANSQVNSTARKKTQ
ncbi:LOW QUALITY PROTEIN: hypothetical protein CVT26_001722 [Gymnopilus dilepis]|uniref:Uncharacterized protein n=1 Tax=Gymnopilus dilepis TaxID=231916 RepID=A0A409VRD3_9AGAR|nr:LOW QUALITY PROTEIN: hypothetical protein CVT26_001722 [Gymnopilus dilepis]